MEYTSKLFITCPWIVIFVKVVQSHRLQSIFFSRTRKYLTITKGILDSPIQLLSLKLPDWGIWNECSSYLSVFDLSIFSFVILNLLARSPCFSTKVSYLVSLLRGTETQITRVWLSTCWCRKIRFVYKLTVLLVFFSMLDFLSKCSLLILSLQ